MTIDWGELWALAARRFTLGDHSVHGLDHWQRVERNVTEIAPYTGADVTLARLFAGPNPQHARPHAQQQR